MQLFDDQPIRSAWNEKEEEWYFSVVDVVGVLTDSPNPQVYWRVMKKRLKDEGNETITNCNGLKLNHVVTQMIEASATASKENEE